MNDKAYSPDKKPPAHKEAYAWDKKAYLILPILAAVSFLAIPHVMYLRAFGVLSIIVALIMFSLMKRRYEREQRKLIVDLTTLIQSLARLKDLSVFPVKEDVLESSLQNQYNKTISLLKKQQTKINQEKDEVKAYISSISHQMKTPIATIKVHTELLMENQLTEQERSAYLLIIQNALKRLEFFAAGMVQSSRLETGLIQLKTEHVSIQQTILQAVMQIRRHALDKNIDIQLQYKIMNVEILHDRHWTTEAIVNILDNGVKYSPEGTCIKIYTRKYEFFYCISIEDEGIGIPPSDVTKIFQRFYRSTDANEQEGLGLGLYIARKIIIMQGGSIAVESLDKGSRFKIYLPLSHHK